MKKKTFETNYFKFQIVYIAGTQLAQKSYEPTKIKTSEMTADNVLAGTQQLRLPLMLLNLI